MESTAGGGPGDGLESEATRALALTAVCERVGAPGIHPIFPQVGAEPQSAEE